MSSFPAARAASGTGFACSMSSTMRPQRKRRSHSFQKLFDNDGLKQSIRDGYQHRRDAVSIHAQANRRPHLPWRNSCKSRGENPEKSPDTRWIVASGIALIYVFHQLGWTRAPFNDLRNKKSPKYREFFKRYCKAFKEVFVEAECASRRCSALPENGPHVSEPASPSAAHVAGLQRN